MTPVEICPRKCTRTHQSGVYKTSGQIWHPPTFQCKSSTPPTQSLNRLSSLKMSCATPIFSPNFLFRTPSPIRIFCLPFLPFSAFSLSTNDIDISPWLGWYPGTEAESKHCVIKDLRVSRAMLFRWRLLSSPKPGEVHFCRWRMLNVLALIWCRDWLGHPKVAIFKLANSYRGYLEYHVIAKFCLRYPLESSISQHSQGSLLKFFPIPLPKGCCSK